MFASISPLPSCHHPSREKALTVAKRLMLSAAKTGIVPLQPSKAVVPDHFILLYCFYLFYPRKLFVIHSPKVEHNTTND